MNCKENVVSLSGKSWFWKQNVTWVGIMVRRLS